MGKIDTSLTHNSEVSYYRHIRTDIAEYVEKGNNRILDVGCGAGFLGEFLKLNGRASEVVGIEIDKVAASEASTRLDRVIGANLNQSGVSEIVIDFDKASFDYIVCADVLEHLIDPWKTLSELLTFLKPGGKVVVSLPNVRHWSVWLPMVFRGRWEYQEAGIMDRTHLRFFTKAAALDLMAGAGLHVIECRPLIGGKWCLVDKFSLRKLQGVIAIQWMLVGIRKENP